MAGNSFGDVFRITTFGESHGKAIGVVIDGCPAGLEIDEAFISSEMERRRPGQSQLVTQRREEDNVEILSGVFEGRATGTPLAMLITNNDQRPADYNYNKGVYRPSHADYTYDAKYGLRDHRGGGRASARETAARVAAGAVAKLLLSGYGINIFAWVSSAGSIHDGGELPGDTRRAKTERDNTPARHFNADTAKRFEDLILSVKKSGDTIGGTVSCMVTGVPPGLGEPVFNKLHAMLGMAMLGINAAHGFEYGSGFEGAKLRGSAHNDEFYTEAGSVLTRTNNSGGIQGGISNGMPVFFRTAFKPVATIINTQQTVTDTGEETEMRGRGRHDPCVLPRAVPVVEAMAALVLADFILKRKTDRL